MISTKLLLELKQIFQESFNIQLTDIEVREMADFLLEYFGLLTGVADE